MNQQTKYLQILCNQLRIRDENGNALVEDGILGPHSIYAIKHLPVLRKGSSGFAAKIAITHIQNVLKIPADGIFGQQTYRSVVSFQRSKGLVQDGVVGPNTWLAFASSSPTPIPHSSLDRFVSIAVSQLGYREKGSNNTKYGEWYGMNNEPWCAMFISWCANESGILNTLVPKYASCEMGVDYYKNRRRYRTRKSGYTPKKGDIIFFYSSNYSIPYYHTGIVEYVSSGIVHTIEGNTDNMVARRSYSLSYSNIDGYGVN